MRRITLWLMSTISALVLLFSYPTSTNSTTAASGADDSVEAAATPNATTTPEATATPDGAATTDGSATSDATPSDASPSDATPSDGSTSATDQSTPSDAGSTSDSATGTFAGDSVMTRWGAVQVQLTVKDGQITKSEVIQIPWDNPRDQKINSYAVPILNKEVVTAQTASIDMVSGATVTSVGYIQSLQSAIDQAHLA